MSPPSMHSNASFDNSPRHATKRDSRMSRNERGRRSSSFSCSRRQDVDRTSTRRRQDIDVTDDWRQLHFKPHRETTYAENQTFARNYRRKSERRCATLRDATRHYATLRDAMLRNFTPAFKLRDPRTQLRSTKVNLRRRRRVVVEYRRTMLRDAARRYVTRHSIFFFIDDHRQASRFQRNRRSRRR